MTNEDEQDKVLVLWFKEQCVLGAPLSGPIIKKGDFCEKVKAK